MAIDRTAGRVLASRLVEAGFAEQAARLVEGISLGLSHEDRLLRAQLALALGRPRRAEAEVLGMVGEDAELVRAEARRQAGDHTRARQAYFQMGKVQEGERQAWLAGDWMALQKADTSQYREFAQIVEPDEPMAETDGVLALNRQRLDQSAKMREVLAALLDLHGVPGN
jgi:hypothetical protein